ncbi:MAG: autotransporter outer membrane beta-barrel domain-containing protein [Planctomycetaceae bacterium]|nr:autotransporter outer membrane beta-barrel domain-containing protein [Planctomycetaceae bacterium]
MGYYSKYVRTTTAVVAACFVVFSACASAGDLVIRGGNGGASGTGGTATSPMGGQGGEGAIVWTGNGSPPSVATTVPVAADGTNATNKVITITNLLPIAAAGGGGGGGKGSAGASAGNHGLSTMRGNFGMLAPGYSGSYSGGDGVGFTVKEPGRYSEYAVVAGAGASDTPDNGGGGGGGGAFAMVLSGALLSDVNVIAGDKGLNNGGYGGSATLVGYTADAGIIVEDNMTVQSGKTDDMEFGKALVDLESVTFIGNSATFAITGGASNSRNAVVTAIGTLSAKGDLAVTLDGTAAGTGGVSFRTIHFNGASGASRIGLTSVNTGAMAFDTVRVTGVNNRLTGNYHLDATIKTLIFDLPETGLNGATMLNATANAVAIADSTRLKLVISSPSTFSADNTDTITLIAGVAGSLTERPEEAVDTLNGLTGHSFVVKADGADLVARYDGPSKFTASGNGYKPYFESALGGMLTIYQSHRVLEGNIAAAVATATPGRFSFAVTADGSSFRHKTGSHVDVDGFGTVLSLARRFTNSMADTVFGAFFETGYGSYDSYNNILGLGRLDGDGDAKYAGGGFFAHLRGGDGWHGEASLRAGWIDQDFTIKGNAGAKYDHANMYWGAHAAFGKVFELGTCNSIDLYGKAFWTRTNSDSVRTGAGERLDMDAIDSVRTRLGFRYSHAISGVVTGYAGAAWEHEFAGKAGGSVNGIAITDKPDVKGSSGFAELGLEIRPTGARYRVDASVYGMVGKQRGVGGRLGVSFAF